MSSSSSIIKKDFEIIQYCNEQVKKYGNQAYMVGFLYLFLEQINQKY